MLSLFLNKEHIYYVIVPFVSLIITLVNSEFIHPKLSGSGWKNVNKKNAADKYLLFQCKVLFCFFISVIFFAIITLLILCGFWLIMDMNGWNSIVSEESIFSIPVGLSIVIFFRYLSKRGVKDKIMKLKYKHQKRKKLSTCLFYMPLVIVGMIFFIDIYIKESGILLLIELALMIVCIGLSLWILDGTEYPEYKYMSIELRNSDIINRIQTNDVKKKGSWIVINRPEEQIRIKYEDVTKIVYSNTIL